MLSVIDYRREESDGQDIYKTSIRDLSLLFRNMTNRKPQTPSIGLYREHGRTCQFVLSSCFPEKVSVVANFRIVF
jgi:hypothetical protein